MASDTNLAMLKSEALSSITQSMSIEYPGMVSAFSNFKSSSFASLLNLYNPTFKKLLSSDINGSTLLAYLDFYTLYIILYANLGPISNLKKLTQNKMAYLLSIYKDTDSIIKEKELQKVNKYVCYTNFLNPKNIDLSISRSYLAKNKLSDPLSTYPVLTLPVETTKDVNVLSVTSTDTDSYVNTIENNSIGNSIEYAVNRKGFNKIGVCDTIIPLKVDNKYNELPQIKGTIHGYFSESMSIVISDVEFDSEGKYVSVKLTGSSNNIDWSEPTTILVDTPTNFYIDNQIDTGLTVTFSSNVIPQYGDAWKINIRYISVDNPMLISAIKFMTLNKISFITWDDINEKSAEFISQRVKYRREEKFKDINETIFSNGINNVAMIFNSVNDYELTLQQNSYQVKSVESQLAHSFKFNISDINGVYNEYKSYGILSFKGISIPQESPILNARLSAKQFISKNYTYAVQPASQTQITGWSLDLSGNKGIKIGQKLFWTVVDRVVTLYDKDASVVATGSYEEATKLVTFTEINGSNIAGTAILNYEDDNVGSNYILILSKQFIEHSMFISFDKDTLFIPCLNNDDEIVSEYIIPEKDETGQQIYKTKFPVDESKDVMVCNVSSKEILPTNEYTIEEIAINTSNPSNNKRYKIAIQDYDVKSIYVVVYQPKVNTYVEASNYVTGTGSWIYNNNKNSSNIYYMYYRDIDNNNRVALCTLGDTLVETDMSLTPFYGSVASVVEMRSLDQGYISPVIFEYSLLAN